MPPPKRRRRLAEPSVKTLAVSGRPRREFVAALAELLRSSWGRGRSWKSAPERGLAAALGRGRRRGRADRRRAAG